MILLLFRRSVSGEAIEKLFRDFGGSLAQWAQVFDRCPGLYAVRIANGSSEAWRDAFTQLPEVEWAEVLRSVSFTPQAL